MADTEKLFTLNSIRQSLTKTVDPKIRICLDCGSSLTVHNEKTIICRDCGNIRFFSNYHLIRTVESIETQYDIKKGKEISKIEQ